MNTEKKRMLDAGPVMTETARRLRQQATRTEDILWRALRGRALGCKFRRQQPIEQCIVDFYCHEARLAVEIDGSAHEGREADDAARDEVLEGLGIRVLRLPTALVETDLPEALGRIEEALQHCGPIKNKEPFGSSLAHGRFPSHEVVHEYTTRPTPLSRRGEGPGGRA